MTFFFKLNKSNKLNTNSNKGRGSNNPHRTEMNKGDMYGHWMVIKEAEPRFSPKGRKLRFALCKCTACNKTIQELRYDSLRIDRGTRSCCLGVEICRQVNTVHGFRKHPIRSTHRNMIERCYNPKCPKYKHYGGRGIKICSEWRNDLGVFATWALVNGYEKGLQIDRKDNDGDYTPDNCRFVTRKVNMNNMSKNLYVFHKGNKYTFTKLWEEFGRVAYFTALHRYQHRGFTAIQAVSTPLLRKYS